jgi:hypothetical protein
MLKRREKKHEFAFLGLAFSRAARDNVGCFGRRAARPKKRF